MKRFFFLLSLSFFILTTLSSWGQKFIRNTDVTGICYAGTKVRKLYVPPPARFFSKSGSKGGGSITVDYHNFSTNAKTAFEYAVSILESMLPPDTKMTIQAYWQSLSNGVLGNSSVTGFALGREINALNPLAYYPVSLAEKIAGESLNEDILGDIEIRINSSAQWYLGTDGNVPGTRYDLITVVIHEICHGLGIFDSMGSEGTVGYYGDENSIGVIYDTFLENEDGLRLTDTTKFNNDSELLLDELTSGKIYFNGPLIKKYTSGKRIKLHAPAIWDDGSSISHIDENVFADSLNQSVNLMTPFIDQGEAIHDPGSLNFSILGDLGWINTRIRHKPHGDTEENMTSLTLSTVIESDTLYNKDNVGVVFSFDDFLHRDTIYLVSNPGNLFSTTIDIPGYNSDLKYYFFVEDYFSRMYRSPSSGELRYETYIGTDTVKPIITHTPLGYCLQTVDSLHFKVEATDNLGIYSVYIEYKINNSNPGILGLTETEYRHFNLSIDADYFNFNGGDTIQYRVFAIDSAISANISVLPKTGFFNVPVEKIDVVLSSYSTDFSNASSTFFNIGFEIIKPEGFTKYGLHTKPVGRKINSISPGKKILSSMTPVIVEKEGKLFLLKPLRCDNY